MCAAALRWLAPILVAVALVPAARPAAPPVAVSATPFSATLEWTTETPTSGRVAYGLAGAEPTLWTAPAPPSTTHRVVLRGLAYGRGYRAVADGAEVEFATPPPAAVVESATRGGALVLDGSAVFPVMLWAACPPRYGEALAAGVTLFMENSCGGFAPQLEALAGRALVAAPAAAAGVRAPGVVGWFQPDEPDGHRLPPSQLRIAPGVSFLTLTSHFFSGAAPLAWGRGMYPALIARADVVGFDLYPLQTWCRDDLRADYDAQRELVARARGKPTFQWIEVREFQCRGRRNAITPASVRAESWLAIAGGAHAVGFFPAGWRPDVGDAMARVTSEIAELAPALLAPTVAAISTAPVVASARSWNGARYVIAVNPTRRFVRASVASPGLAGPLRVLDEGRTVTAREGALRDGFAPFAAHVYVAPPR